MCAEAKPPAGVCDWMERGSVKNVKSERLASQHFKAHNSFDVFMGGVDSSNSSRQADRLNYV